MGCPNTGLKYGITEDKPALAATQSVERRWQADSGKARPRL